MILELLYEFRLSDKEEFLNSPVTAQYINIRTVIWGNIRTVPSISAAENKKTENTKVVIKGIRKNSDKKKLEFSITLKFKIDCLMIDFNSLILPFNIY